MTTEARTPLTHTEDGTPYSEFRWFSVSLIIMDGAQLSTVMSVISTKTRCSCGQCPEPEIEDAVQMTAANFAEAHPEIPILGGSALRLDDRWQILPYEEAPRITSHDVDNPAMILHDSDDELVDASAHRLH